MRVYRNPGKEEIFPALLDKGNVNLLYTYFEVMQLIVTHICMFGNAYVQKVRAKDLDPDEPGYAKKGSSGEDTIVDLRPINPSRVKVRTFEGNKLFEVITLDKNGKIDNSHQPVIMTTFEIMHIPGMGYDGLVGLSVVENCSRTLGTSIAADKLAARFYQNGSMLGGIIKVKAPLASQTQADEIRRRWLVKHSGVQNSGDVAVLDAETDYQPVTIPPDQLQFLESRGWQTREVARMFGIPPHLVGDVEKSTSWGTGIEQQNVGFVAYTISEWTSRIEQRFTREIINVRKQYAEFDLDHLLRGAMQDRFDAYSSAIQAGWMTRNEARGKENMVPLKELDDPLMPLNLLPVSLAVKMANIGMQPTSIAPATGAIKKPAKPANNQDTTPPKPKGFNNKKGGSSLPSRENGSYSQG